MKRVYGYLDETDFKAIEQKIERDARRISICVALLFIGLSIYGSSLRGEVIDHCTTSSAVSNCLKTGGKF